MAQRSLTVTVPEILAHEFDSANQDFLVELLKRGLREVKIDRALDLYRQGGMSFGAAAQRAGVSPSELARHAFARGIRPPSSRETLLEELAEA